MQAFIFIATVACGIYFLLFDRESPIAVTIAALSPLGFAALFLLRFLTEKKKRKEEREQIGPRIKKKFKDPNDYVKDNS